MFFPLRLLHALISFTNQQRIERLCTHGFVASLPLPVLLALLPNPVELLRGELLAAALLLPLGPPALEVGGGDAHVWLLFLYASVYGVTVTTGCLPSALTVTVAGVSRWGGGTGFMVAVTLAEPST